MTDRIQEIQARCEAATPGPWEADETGYDVITKAFSHKDKRTGGYGSEGNFICDLNDGEYHEYADKTEQVANAEFIAHAREDMPWLLAQLAELREKTRDMGTACHGCRLQKERNELRKENANLTAQLAEAQRRERAAVEWADTFAHALRYRNDVGGCEAAWLEQYDEWRGPQDGKGEANANG